MTTPPAPDRTPRHIDPELRRRWRLVVDSSPALLVVAALLKVWALLTG
jgi:hypothetical protein